MYVWRCIVLMRVLFSYVLAVHVISTSILVDPRVLQVLFVASFAALRVDRECAFSIAALGVKSRLSSTPSCARSM